MALKGVLMSAEESERLIEAIDSLEALARACTPAEAAREFDPADLQTFWREWPHASVWAGNLWRELNKDLDAPSSERLDRDRDEVGGSG